MATAANLVVKISAQAQNLQRNLNSARGRISKFVSATISRLKQIGKVLAVALAAATGAILFQINKTSKAIDGLVKTSEKLGIPVDQLQRLRFAANRAGISTEKLEMGLQRMVRRVAEASRGTGEARDTIKQLGLSAKELVALSPDKQFLKIAAAMTKIGNQGIRIAATQKLFDSEGVDKVKLFTKALQGTLKEFDRYGATITAAQAKAVVAFEDAKTNLSTLVTSIKQQVTANIAPIFTTIIEHIIQTVQEMGGVRTAALNFTSVLVRGVTIGIEALGFMIDSFNILKILVDGIKVAFQRLVVILVTVAESFSRIGIAIKEIGLDKPGFGIGSAIFELTQQSKLGAAAIQEAKKDTTELQKSLEERIRNFGSNIALDNLRALSDKLKETSKEIKQNVVEAKKAIEDVAPTRALGEGGFSRRDRKQLDRLIRSDTPAAEININVTGEIAEFLNFVAENTEFGDKVQQIINVNTERARRRIDR